MICSVSDIKIIPTMQPAIRDIVKERARERGISLRQLAQLLGVTNAYLHEILRGSGASRPLIRRIAHILDLPDLPERYEQFLHERKSGRAEGGSQSKKAVDLDKKEG